MKSKIKTDSMNSSKFVERDTRNYTKFIDEMDDAFLDAPHSKSFTVPQGGFGRPTVPEIQTEGRAGVPIAEAAIFLFFSFCLGFWTGASHVNGVLRNSYPNTQLDQAAGYAVIALIPVSWMGIAFLYFRKRRKR